VHVDADNFYLGFTFSICGICYRLIIEFDVFAPVLRLLCYFGVMNKI